MRICHIIESGGGSGQVVLDLAIYQADNGHEVTVIYSPARAWPQFVRALDKRPDIRVITMPMQRKVGLHDLMSSLQLRDILSRERPFDIVHSHSSKAGALARLTGLFFKAKQVYTPHGFITLVPTAGGHYKWIELFLSLLCHRIIAVSEKEKEHARSLGIAERRLSVVPNGTEPKNALSFHEARDTLTLPETGRVIGFAGRFSYQKNPVLAVETFALLAADYPDVTLCMVGDGELMPEVRAAVERLGLQDRVLLTGMLDAAPLLVAFDLLLCTSVYEGMPIVFIEALAANVPIVSTDVGGTEEGIIPGITGFVAEAQTPEALAEACRKCLDLDDTQKAAMKIEIARLSEGFTAGAMGGRTARLYDSLMAS